MRTPNEKIVAFDHFTATRLSADTQPANAGDMVGQLLRKLENDVAAIVSHPREAPVQEDNPAPQTNPLQAELDEDAPPLPRMFNSLPDSETTTASLARQENYVEYKSAAFRGFCIGMIAIVPALVWITFSLLPSPEKSTDTQTNRPNTTLASALPALVAPPRQQAGPSASLARSAALIRQGRVREARSVLSSVTLLNDPSVAMAMAETYDPNMLAAWNTLDIEPDVAKARAFYQQAADGGIEGAARRLQGLR